MSLIERIDREIKAIDGCYGQDPNTVDLLRECKAEIEQLRKDKAEVERLLNELLAAIKGSKE